jgi:ATP-GRASP peptide maturase of grasp-with-spasm system
MILIFSTHNDDTTNEVIEWLAKKSNDISRYNYFGDKFPSITSEFSGDSVEFKVDNKKAEAIWFRKSLNPFKYEYDGESPDIKMHIKNELRAFKEALFLMSQHSAKTLGTSSGYNKIQVLHAARAHGLHVPATIVTNSLSDLIEFKKKYKEIIIKCLSEADSFKRGETSHILLTSALTDSVIKTLPSEFFPCFVQERIFKRYEVRTFFLEGKCYSAAIFSQNNKKTKVDYRNYDYGKMNRYVPYQLDHEIEEKVSALMDFLGLDTGSLDFMVTKDNKVIFLEINPSGQFGGMVSKPCNYFLEKKVADSLIKKTLQ